MNIGRPARPLGERFWENVCPEPNSGCFLWMGSVIKQGYGRIRRENCGPGLTAHRASWEIHYGAIPEGMCVLHKCDTPSCVRPEHLFLGTNKDNTQDCIAKGRFVSPHAARNKAKTHCIHGHEFTADNTRIRLDGSRACIKCWRQRNKAHRDASAVMGSFRQ